MNRPGIPGDYVSPASMAGSSDWICNFTVTQTATRSNATAITLARAEIVDDHIVTGAQGK